MFLTEVTPSIFRLLLVAHLKEKGTFDYLYVITPLKYRRQATIYSVFWFRRYFVLKRIMARWKNFKNQNFRDYTRQRGSTSGDIWLTVAKFNDQEITTSCILDSLFINESFTGCPKKTGVLHSSLNFEKIPKQ